MIVQAARELVTMEHDSAGILICQDKGYGNDTADVLLDWDGAATLFRMLGEILQGRD